MTDLGTFGDVRVELADHIATVEIHRPPNNFFDQHLIASLADALETVDAERDARVSLLCSEGKHFCAGANFHANDDDDRLFGKGRHLYEEAVRIFRCRKPIVAAVQGAAIGGGLGVALVADFRVAAPEARFSANFARLGFHHGFGLSVTLPRLVGQQRAMDLLYTGRRVTGEEARTIGLCDQLAPLREVRSAAHALCTEIATSAPLAVESIRETLRGDLADQIRVATQRERWEQERHQKSNDWKEGVAAMGERRKPNFTAS